MCVQLCIHIFYPKRGVLMIYANDFAPCDGKLKVFSVGHNENVQKADAFVICYDKDVYLIDGGHVNTYHGLEFLLTLRRSYLKGKTDLLRDIDCKLRINLIVSHFHVDHAAALSESICANAFIDVADVYVPEEGRMPREYLELTDDSERKFRYPLLKVLENLHPRALVNNIRYGEENVTELSHGDLSITIYPFPFDPCKESYVKYMCDLYATLYKDENGNLPDMRPKSSTYTLNAGSLWVRFKLGENVFLFTGDTMKRIKDCDGEALDIMMKAYKEKIGKVTVLKYVHHGHARGTAAAQMLSFEPEYILLTTQVATADKTIRDHFPESEVKFVNSGLETVLFECDKDSGVTLSYPQRKG